MKSEKVLLIIIGVLLVILIASVFYLSRGSNQQLKSIIKLTQQSRVELNEFRGTIESQRAILDGLQQSQSQLGNAINGLSINLQELRELEERFRESQQQTDGWGGQVRTSIGDLRTVIEATLQGLEEGYLEDSSN